ncbi:hypothetical protein ASD31_12960 [Rhizobium sp. Root482]|nr:hypothetical protein ASD31_12960 [Rhizobium sp. Root482]
MDGPGFARFERAWDTVASLPTVPWVESTGKARLPMPFIRHTSALHATVIAATGIRAGPVSQTGDNERKPDDH